MWKTWAIILRMFHEENIVFLTRRSAVFQTQSWSYGGLTVVLRWSYDSSHGKKTSNFPPIKVQKTCVKHRT